MDSPVHLLRALVLGVLLLTSCGRQPDTATVTPTVDSAAPAQEATFAAQAAAVREGRSDQIRLAQTLVTDEDLAQLAGCESSLRRINLSHTSITAAGLARIAAMPNLVQLRLASPQLTDQGLAELTRLKHLAHLHLLDAPLTDAGLAQLEPLTHLRSLYLDGTRATDAGIARLIEALPDVHLHLDGGHPPADPRPADHQH